LDRILRVDEGRSKKCLFEEEEEKDEDDEDV
jgi:hypothetical protein